MISGLIELNEAFASQAVACIRELKFDLEKTNVNGSGISLGHPIGCTGARLIVTLLHEMKRKRSISGWPRSVLAVGRAWR